jgi:hypothetical protein
LLLAFNNSNNKNDNNKTSSLHLPPLTTNSFCTPSPTDPSFSSMTKHHQTRVDISSAQSPIIVIIHEAWHTPTHYSRLVDLLTAEGYAVVCPQLPTSQSDNDCKASFSDDCSLIYELVFDIVSDGREVVLFAHGYGSFVATESLAGVSKKTRSDSKLDGGVIGMVIVAGFLPKEGDSLKKCLGGEWPMNLQQQVCSLYGTLYLHMTDGYLRRTVVFYCSNRMSSCSKASVRWRNSIGVVILSHLPQTPTTSSFPLLMPPGDVSK